MQYDLDKLSIDIGTTPVENMFFHTYLLMASGDAVRLYLYAYKKAYAREDISLEITSQQLGLSIEEIHRLWDYWVSMGIVEKIYEEDGNYKICFHSLRQLYLDNLAYVKPQNASVQIGKKEEVDPIEHAIDQMFTEIEKTLGIVLTPNEIGAILDAMNDYKSSPQLVARAFSYSVEELGKRDLHYALGVLRKWFIAKVYTLEDLKEHLEKQKEKPSMKKTTNLVENRYGTDEMKELIARKLRQSREGL